MVSHMSGAIPSKALGHLGLAQQLNYRARQAHLIVGPADEASLSISHDRADPA